MIQSYSKSEVDPRFRRLLTLRSLFRPYIKLDLSGANLYPRDTCTFCANEISSIMGGLRAMYGLRRVNLAVVERLMSALTIHLLNLPSEPAASNLSQGLLDLQAISLNHQFASKCMDIIRSLAVKWNIALPDAAASIPTRNKGPGGQRQQPSPQNDSFWAAAIPRKESSDDSSRSVRSSSSQQGSPFLPPATQPSQQHQHGYNANFFGDQSTALDALQAHNSFWTPFPLQNAPVPPQNVVPSMSMDVEGHSDQWPMYQNSLNQNQHPPSHLQQQMSQGLMDSMGFSSWQWHQ